MKTKACRINVIITWYAKMDKSRLYPMVPLLHVVYKADESFTGCHNTG